MSNKDSEQGRCCDICGRNIMKAHRVYEGEDHCAACYKRRFKHRLCPRCGNTARLPVHNSAAICRKCETNCPCVRCGKTSYKTGKITPYGPACKSCAEYFLEPRECSICGKPSRRLSRVRHGGLTVLACPACSAKLRGITRGTCRACRRHRDLQESTEGLLLCCPCIEIGEVPCPLCACSMPAGRGRQCEECALLVTLRRRIELNRAAFRIPEMAQRFSEFGEWLHTEVGPGKAARSINRYLTFFTEIEEHWQGLPDYAELLRHFSAGGLRRVLLPMKWLALAYGIIPDPRMREEDSERRRIKQLLAGIPQTTELNTALRLYWKHLEARIQSGKLTLRSARLALRPAVSLVQISSQAGENLPSQSSVDHYLLSAPGQRATLTGFITFLNGQYTLALNSTVDSRRVETVRRKKLEAEMLSLMRDPPQGAEGEKRWLSISLAYFHGMPHSVAKELDDDNVSGNLDGSFTIHWGGLEYWVPGMPEQEDRLA